jgi:hypothetical protein
LRIAVTVTEKEIRNLNIKNKNKLVKKLSLRNREKIEKQRRVRGQEKDGFKAEREREGQRCGDVRFLLLFSFYFRTEYFF